MSAPATAPRHLLDYLARHAIAGEFVAPGVPMPTVSAAAGAIGVPEEQIVKTVLFQNRSGASVVAIANGSRRIDRNLLSAAAGIDNLRIAAPADVIAITGYPAGGVAPVGLPEGLAVVVEVAVVSLPVAYGGGGHEELLLKIIPADIVRCNNAVVTTIVVPGEPS